MGSTQALLCLSSICQIPSDCTSDYVSHQERNSSSLSDHWERFSDSSDSHSSALSMHICFISPARILPDAYCEAIRSSSESSG